VSEADVEAVMGRWWQSKIFEKDFRICLNVRAESSALESVLQKFTYYLIFASTRFVSAGIGVNLRKRKIKDEDYF